MTPAETPAPHSADVRDVAVAEKLEQLDERKLELVAVESVDLDEALIGRQHRPAIRQMGATT